MGDPCFHFFKIKDLGLKQAFIKLKIIQSLPHSVSGHTIRVKIKTMHGFDLSVFSVILVTLRYNEIA
jgi:hypothetical protein